MTRILFLLITLSLLSCESDKTNKSQLKKSENIEIDSTTVSEPLKNGEFPMDEIIMHFEKRKSRYVFEYTDYDSNYLIPLKFVKKYFANKPIENIKDYKLEFDEYSNYYYFDFADFDDFTLFTIIQSDENGYIDFYHFTYNKSSKKIGNVVRIATAGGDGGLLQNEKLYYSNSFKDLVVKTISTYDEDIYTDDRLDINQKDCYTRLTEKYETKFIFTKNESKVINGNVSSKTDTICRNK